VVEDAEALQADDGSMQIVEDWEHSRYDMVTSNVDKYKGEDGDDADEEEEASQAVAGST
jgi:hypothetical protein